MYSEITISDNGCGISPKDLPHIFERFYKARNSSPSSVGIGLSLAKSIVEKQADILPQIPNSASAQPLNSDFECKTQIR